MATNTTLPADVASARESRKAAVAMETHRIKSSSDEIATKITGATSSLRATNRSLAALGFDPMGNPQRTTATMTARVRDLVFKGRQIRLYQDYKFKEMKLFTDLLAEVRREEVELVEKEKAPDEAAGVVG